MSATISDTEKAHRPMLRPDQISSMPVTESSVRIAFQTILHRFWQAYNSSPKRSSERLEAERKIQFLSNYILTRWQNVLSQQAKREAQLLRLKPLTVISYHIPQDLSNHYSRLRACEVRLDKLWKAYINLGLKFHLNIPLTIYDDPRLNNSLRLIFDPDIDIDMTLQILHPFPACRARIDFTERLLIAEQVREARYSLWRLEKMVMDVVEQMRMLQWQYEDLLAAVNSRNAMHQFIRNEKSEDESVKAFWRWKRLVRISEEMEPEEFFAFCERIGWEWGGRTVRYFEDLAFR